MLLTDYIKQHHNGNKAAFARSQSTPEKEVFPQAVTKWINAKWIVVDGQLYSPKRKIETVSTESK